MQAIASILFEVIDKNIMSSRSVPCKKDNTCYGRFLVTFPGWISKPNSFAHHSFLMVLNILIIFASKHVTCKRDNSHFPPYVLMSPAVKISYRHITPILFELIWKYLVGTYISTRRGITCKKDNSCFVLFLLISPEWVSQPNSCALHNF